VDLKGPLSENYFYSSNEYFQKDLRTITLFETSIVSKPKFKSSNHKQIEKNQENKPQHKNLSKKRGSSDLNKSSDYTTLPLYIKQYLNYTIMHLSTTTKNKLQRIKYNKV
jgi:hypothetical protein